MAEQPIRKLFVVKDCVRDCPFVRVTATPSAGCADDYHCHHPKSILKNGLTGRMITGYIEWSSELPPAGEFPDWCPLYTLEPGMYED